MSKKNEPTAQDFEWAIGFFGGLGLLTVSLITPADVKALAILLADARKEGEDRDKRAFKP